MRPYPIAVQLEPIWKLISNSERRNAVKALWEKKMGSSNDSLDAEIPCQFITEGYESNFRFTENNRTVEYFNSKGVSECGVTVSHNYREDNSMTIKFKCDVYAHFGISKYRNITSTVTPGTKDHVTFISSGSFLIYDGKRHDMHSANWELGNVGDGKEVTMKYNDQTKQLAISCASNTNSFNMPAWNKPYFCFFIGKGSLRKVTILN